MDIIWLKNNTFYIYFYVYFQCYISLIIITKLVEELGGNNERNDKLTCPVCSKIFENTPENTQILAIHVEDHFTEELKCPICNLSFHISKQRKYERHVNVSIENIA